MNRRVHKLQNGSVTYYQFLKDYEDIIKDIEAKNGQGDLNHLKKLKQILRRIHEYFYEKLITWENKMKQQKPADHDAGRLKEVITWMR